MLKSKPFPSIIKTFGNSMYPMLMDQDIVYLKKVKFEKIKVTDVICIRKKSKIYTHRVIYKSNKYLVTKGDSNMESDGKIFEHQMIGKVIRIRRNEQEVTLEDLYLFQATTYFDEIKKVTKKFEENNIGYIILKGLPLDLYYSKEHPTKIYSDCDILINPKDKIKANTILYDSGFTAEGQKKYSHLQRFIGAEIKELLYYKTSSNFLLRFDVHYEINVFSHITKLPFPFLQRISDHFTKNIMKNKQFVVVKGTRFPILKYDDLIIYLLLHTFGHGYTGMLRFEAIKNLLIVNNNSYSKQLEDIIKKANRFKLIAFIAPPLYIIYKYYGIENPYKIIKKEFPFKSYFSLIVYHLITKEEQVFDDLTATYSTRFRRALFLFFLSEENVLIKLYYVLQPKLILHLLFFILIYMEKKVRNLGLQ